MPKNFNVNNLTLDALKDIAISNLENVEVLTAEQIADMKKVINGAETIEALGLFDCLFGHTWDKSRIPYRCVVCGVLAN